MRSTCPEKNGNINIFPLELEREVLNVIQLSKLKILSIMRVLNFRFRKHYCIYPKLQAWAMSK